MAKKQDQKKPPKSVSQKKIKNVIQKSVTEKGKLMFGGMYLPEADLKENTLTRTYRHKEKLDERLRKICMACDVSCNNVVNRLIEAFCEENKDKIKTDKTTNNG